MPVTLDEVLAAHPTAKRRSKAVGMALLDGSMPSSALAAAMPRLAPKDLATAIEGLEGATRQSPMLVDRRLGKLLVGALRHDAPAVRREAARAIANVAPTQPALAGIAVDALLTNASDASTVVRWAAAQALVALWHASHARRRLGRQLGAIAAREADGGVRAVYERALQGRARRHATA